ncbi:hypothetical protein BI362_05415 [Streptococcus parauberis]|nr:hypothetical protein BI362_05415 [Streptococcus parauberis]
MLMKKKDNKLMILDRAKLITVNKINNIESLPNNKIVEIRNSNKKYINVRKFSWTNKFHKSYSFFEKKSLIEKLELNFGSLLSLNNVTNIITDQYPLFNINYKNIVLMDKNLQNIYIKYFLRYILPYEVSDIIVDEEDYHNYKQFLNKDNTDNCIAFKYKNRIKIFDELEKKEEYIKQFKQIKGHHDLEIEGITSKEIKLEEVVLFNQYSCLIIR